MNPMNTPFPAPNSADQVKPPAPKPPKPSRNWLPWLIGGLIVLSPIVVKVADAVDNADHTAARTDDMWRAAWDDLPSEQWAPLCDVVTGNSDMSREELIAASDDPYADEFLDWIEEHVDSLCGN